MLPLKIAEDFKQVLPALARTRRVIAFEQQGFGHTRIAPQPENFESFFYKGARRMRDFKDIPPQTIRAITAPVLVVNGDADLVRPEHAVELFRLLPHAQLSVLPGTDHFAIMKRTASLVPMIEEFLDAQPAK